MWYITTSIIIAQIAYTLPIVGCNTRTVSVAYYDDKKAYIAYVQIFWDTAEIAFSRSFCDC